MYLHNLWRIFLSTLLVGLALSRVGTQPNVHAEDVFKSSNNPAYSHCTNCLHNATEKRDGTAWGVRSYISWTDPPLNGGAWTYHRVAMAQWTPWRFSEFGWQKTASGFRGMIAYEAGSGVQNVPVTGIAATTHRYTITYSASSGKHLFYVDGLHIISISVGFTSSNAVIGGGETTGVEGMGNTQLYTLEFQASSSGGYQAWNGHVSYIDDLPYYNGYVNNNSFTDKGP